MGTGANTTKLSKLILRNGSRLLLPKNQVIQSTDTGNKLCLITKGFAKRYLILNDGNIRVQIIYGPKDIFPLTLAFKTLLGQDLYTGPEVYYYETLCKTEIFTLDKQKLLEYIAQDTSLYRDLYSEAGRRLYSNIQRLENLGLPTMYMRVAHELAFYATEFGEKSGTGIKINVPLTQQDLADILSSTRETVSLSISQLKKKGLLAKNSHLIVPSLKKLQNEVFS